YGSPTFYAKDAMTGLRIMNELMDPEVRESALSAHLFVEQPSAAPAESHAPSTSTARSSKVRTDVEVPTAPYLDRRVRQLKDLHEIWSYINPYMLYGRHLGFKGNFEKLLLEHDATA